ncbi:lysylphosphatidylglycerol synthase domain-containing protein [Salinarimonas ramus]|uniref:Membrane protein n=1 Tax=Salinarimonas ramus TaxID=690164 RepID=A0A917V5Q9_9HYPH|nr:lysylphosphatidylglycerol synthase domain-containing protein [Salinarimonas ramus]GGK40517.1 membrane protein [Salinarimonas ramus]
MIRSLPLPKAFQKGPPARRTLVRAMQVVFWLAALAALAYAYRANEAAIVEALSRVSPVALAAACAVAALGAVPGALAWVALARAGGMPVPWGRGTAIYLVSNLGKYVPGGFWAILSQAAHARPWGMTLPRAAGLFLLAMLCALLAAGLVGLPAFLGAFRIEGALAAALVVVALLGAAAALKLLPFLAGIAARRLPFVPDESLLARLDTASLSRATAIMLVAWPLTGLHLAILAAPFSDDVIFLVSAYAFASALSLVLPILPAGLGAREGALMACLVVVMPAAEAAVIVVLSRLVVTMVELAAAALASLVRPERHIEATPALDTERP